MGQVWIQSNYSERKLYDQRKVEVGVEQSETRGREIYKSRESHESPSERS